MAISRRIIVSELNHQRLAWCTAGQPMMLLPLSAVLPERFRYFVLVACQSAIGKYVDMTDPSNGRPSRWWPAVLAGSTAVVMAAMGVATNIATSLLPGTWQWARDATIIWTSVGVLLVLAVALAVMGSRTRSRYVDDRADSSNTTRDTAGGVVTGAGAVVVTGPGPVFIDQRARADILVPGTRADSPGGDRQVVAGEIPARPVAFLKREAADDLAAAWDAGVRVSVVQAVTGSLGVGKTQAAAAYARDRVATGWPLVAWVTAETHDQLLAGLANVAVAVGVADADGDSAVSARNVRHYLENFPGPALVVFDNATDVDELFMFLPTVGAVQIVITSTDRAFTRLGMEVDVGLFTPEQSVAYLKQRTGLADSAATAVVAAELGYLPLALAQAATVITQQSLDYVTYQRRLHHSPAAKYLTRHAGDPYPRGAVEAIALAVHTVEIQDDSGLTGLIMGLLSVLSAEGVDRSFLSGLTAAPITALSVSPFPAPDEAVDQALGHLVAGSILTRSQTGQVFSMHRLVSRVVRERDEAEGRSLIILRAAMDLLHALEVPRGEEWLHRETGSELVEQISSLWAVSSSLVEADDPQFCTDIERLIALRNWSVGQLTGAADLSRAISLGATVQAECERLLGLDHLDTLTSRGNLAQAYRSAGQVREAIALHERNLADRERLLGPDHPDTLTSRDNLAKAHKSAHHLREAIALHERNLADRERLLGPDHPDTLTSRGNLAKAYGSAGQVREAIALHERNLADRERLLGPDHFDTLTSRNDLAGAYGAAGRVREAIALHQRNLADRERLLGPDHPYTLTSRNDLAETYRVAGRPLEAIALHERNLTDRERVLGRDHPTTLVSRNNLGLTYGSAGRLRKAIASHERNLADRERLLGPDHPDTLTSRGNLALAYGSAGRLRKAIALHQRNLADRERLLGPDHPDTLTSRANLAKAHGSAGRLRKAIASHERNLADRERVLGPDHPHTLISRDNLALAYRSVGRLREGRALRLRNAAEANNALGLEHPYRRRYLPTSWLRLFLSVILAIAVLSTALPTQSVIYRIITFILLWLVFMILSILILRAIRLFLAARDWRFLSFPWYQQLRYFITSATRPGFKRQ